MEVQILIHLVVHLTFNLYSERSRNCWSLCIW